MITLDKARAYIDQLDLSYIVDAMCAPAYPLPRWNEADARLCAQLYKDFLYLQKKYLPESLVPTREIDEFWHNHILYTKNYLHDCLQIFGHYLHHEPAIPSESTKTLIENYLKTKAFYLKEFNRPLELLHG